MNIGTIFESKNAIFFEDIFPMRGMSSMSSWESSPNPELQTPMEFGEESNGKSSDSEENDNEAPTRSRRQRTAKSFGNDFIVYPIPHYHFRSSYISGCRLRTKLSEMNSILSNRVWELTEHPYGCKPVGCKRVFEKML
jgi:hypothetical protein